MVKHFGSEIFGLRPILHTTYDERIHALKVCFVEIREALGILLCRLDQQPFLFHHL